MQNHRNLRFRMDGISESHKKENFTNMEILTRTYFIVAG
jgi:hypothetical protein